MQFRLYSLFLSICLVPLFSSAQKLPEIDVYGGYSYIRFNSTSLGFSDYSGLNGWEASVTAPHLYQALGLTVNASGDYGSPLTLYNFMLGPQFTGERGHFRYFGNVLGGKAETKITVPQSTRGEISSEGRALAVGGGVDWVWGRHISVRLIDADYIAAKTFGSSQHHARISAGVVYRFGKK